MDSSCPKYIGLPFGCICWTNISPFGDIFLFWKRFVGGVSSSSSTGSSSRSSSSSSSRSSSSSSSSSSNRSRSN